MVAIFDDPEVAYRTPVAWPFDLAAAAEFFEMTQRVRADGIRLHLAVTTDGSTPCGEVLVNLATCSIAYTIGPAFRGRGLASRAAALLTGYAHNTLGIRRLRAEIEPDNDASIAVAESVGYRLSDEAPEPVEDGRRSFTLLTWVHEI